ncbi:MAG: hypothetical protein KGL48_17460 [Sphingomonadales bacterium]|nr:hypothetical protein [Sphingomonadales bacterium]MDE2568674.1 hypothetical protein [Sphingomonadales bacterium]
MRLIIAAALILGLAACSRASDGPGKDARTIDCALGGSAQFEKHCWVETDSANGRKVLVVRAPDGSFRRFIAVDDGRGAVPADGSEDATAQWVGGGKLQVTVGSDRYLFPAAVKPEDAAKR